MERYFGIDVGEKRIGVSVSDPLGITAQPLEIITRDGQGSEWKRFPEIVKEYSPVKAIIGLPLNMNGTEGEQSEAARLFGKTFSRKFPEMDNKVCKNKLNQIIIPHLIRILINMHIAYTVIE